MRKKKLQQYDGCVILVRASRYSVWFPGSRPRISGGGEMLWEIGCREKIMGK